MTIQYLYHLTVFAIAMMNYQMFQSSKKRRSKAKQTDSNPIETSPSQTEYSGFMTRSRTRAISKD